jgi:predicted RNase H-like HicB family nuclease
MDNNNKQIYNYTVLLEKESDGGYHAFCPILKGCHSQGDSFEEAIDNITEAIELYIESLKAENLSIPKYLSMSNFPSVKAKEFIKSNRKIRFLF